MPEGFFSLNDKINHIMSTEQGRQVFGGLMMKLAPKEGDKVAGFEMSQGIMEMLGGFTVMRFAGMVGTVGIKFSKEDLLELNTQLNKIKKPN